MAADDGRRPTSWWGLRQRSAQDNTERNPAARQRDTVRAAIDAFKASGLFAAEWYSQTYPDVAQAGLDTMRHFLEVGWKEGRKPNPYFDPQWYLARNADVLATGMNPLLHYWRFGERENRQPCPLFETGWYRATYAAEIGAGSALAHYLAHRHLKRFSPNRFFDIAYYLERNPDVAAADVDPLEHFVTTGFREGRPPSAVFDLHFYVRKHMRGDGRDPLTHYFEVGRAAGLSTFHDPNATTPASEIRKFTSKGPDFEEVSPHLVGNANRRAKVLAFYLPQFHSFPENDRWWGKGFTEWTNIARGTPRFRGHYQPRVPRDFGFYDLSDPSVLKRQYQAAKAAGIFGFCFYYYNFNGKRLLDRPVDAFLNDSEIAFPFCVMWANENWTRRWDGAESELLIRQDYSAGDADALVDDLARHFRDPRYIRIEGRPLLLLYRPDIVPNAAKTISHWRELFSSRHGERPWILMAQAFDSEDPREFGCDGAFEFPPHKVVKRIKTVNAECEPFDDSFSAQVYRYSDIAEASLSEPAPPFPLIKTTFPSWDNDARRQGHGLTVVGSSPAAYEKWLFDAIDFARANPFHGESLVFVNAWNEWAEGAYLEPDLHFGGAYLNATARAIAGLDSSGERRKLLLVGHDAFPAGAQLILLHLAKTMKSTFGVEVEVVLCADGELLSTYREAVPTHLATTPHAVQERVRKLRDRGFRTAVTNTVAAGVVVKALKESGFSVTSLVHELPRILSEKHLDAAAAMIASDADAVVFPAEAVRRAFETSVCRPSNAVHVRPQGLYHVLDRVPDAKERILKELDLAPETKIVLNIGYGDLRKGIDLFCAASQVVASKMPDVVFIWVGKLDQTAAVWLDDRVAFPNVRFVGQRSDVATFLSAADAFALTSREDPFPSVVLEALSLNVPVLGFDGGGGFVDLLKGRDGSELVPFANVPALGDAIVRILNRGAPGTRAGTHTSGAFAAADFSFDSYAFDLLGIAGLTTQKISVIVPNFNYAQYLGERLRSIFNQSHPIFELIVLDDASTDNSLEVLETLRGELGREFRVVVNDKNSGNVFAQWARGVELARGDLIWIAEADDIAHPNFLHRLAHSFLGSDTRFAFCDSRAIDSSGNELDVSYKKYYSKVGTGYLAEDERLAASDFATRHLSERNLILNVSAVLWRKDCLRDALARTAPHLKKVRLVGDWLTYISACTGPGSVFYCAEMLNSHRRHEGGVTGRMAIRKQAREIALGHEFFNRLFGEDDGRLTAQARYLDELRLQAEEEPA